MVPTGPRFFKPIIAVDHLVKIPPAFVAKHLEEEYPKNVALLQGREGRIWPVKIEADHSFGEGWKEFFRDHELEVGYFLVFCHRGDLLFLVDVMDRSTCKKDYPPFLARETIKVEEEEESLQPQEVTRTASRGKMLRGGSSDVQDYPTVMIKLRRSYARGRALNFPNLFVTTNQLEKRKSAEVILVDPLGEEWRGFKFLPNPRAGDQISITRGWHNYSMSLGLQEGASILLELIQNTKKVVKFQLYHEVSAKGLQSKKESVKKLKSFELKHRNFTIALKKTNLRGYMTIPKIFAERYGLAHQGGKVTLQNGKGESWEVALTDDTRVAAMGRGWVDVVKANELQEGDLVIFHLIKAGSNPKMKFEVVGKH